jgi:hypothetical protein
MLQNFLYSVGGVAVDASDPRDETKHEPKQSTLDLDDLEVPVTSHSEQLLHVASNLDTHASAGFR